MVKNIDILTEAKEYYKDKIYPKYFWDMVYIIESQDRDINRLCEMLVINKRKET